MIVAFNDSDVLVEPEDRASQQERLRHVVEQPGGDVLDADHLVGYERDTAHLRKIIEKNQAHFPIHFPHKSAAQTRLYMGTNNLPFFFGRVQEYWGGNSYLLQ